MIDTGKIQGSGFTPAFPQLENVLEHLNMGAKSSGWEALKKSAEEGNANKGQEGRERLERAYVRFAASDDGKLILEDLLDTTLRRGTHHPNFQNATMEQVAMNAMWRNGENNIIVRMLLNIARGRALPDPNSVKRKPAKKIR